MKIAYGKDHRMAANAYDVIAVNKYGLEATAQGLRKYWEDEVLIHPEIFHVAPSVEDIAQALHVACHLASADDLNAATAKGGLEVYWPAVEGYL